MGIRDFILNSSLARQLKETLDDAALRPFKGSDAQNAHADVTMSHFIITLKKRVLQIHV